MRLASAGRQQKAGSHERAQGQSAQRRSTQSRHVFGTMTAPPLMDDRRHDPFGRSALPTYHLDRQSRVALLLQAADALVASSPVPQDAAHLLGGALQVFLRQGGDLDRLLGIRGIPGSHLTVPALARKIVMDGVSVDGALVGEVRTFDGS